LAAMIKRSLSMAYLIIEHLFENLARRMIVLWKPFKVLP
jgi:hypothetical protein